MLLVEVNGFTSLNCVRSSIIVIIIIFFIVIVIITLITIIIISLFLSLSVSLSLFLLSLVQSWFHPLCYISDFFLSLGKTPQQSLSFAFVGSASQGQNIRIFKTLDSTGPKKRCLNRLYKIMWVVPLPVIVSN